MEKDHPQICEDKQLNGVCSKGADCEICNPKNQIKDILNPGAKEYVPKKKTKQQVPEKLNFNLEAKEFVPKSNQEEIEDDDEEDQEQLDMIMKDVVENDILDEFGEESDDEDKWYPKYKDCECCKGFVYKCKGKACENLGQCYCKMKDDCEDN